jgi:hypothetical protein
MTEPIGTMTNDPKEFYRFFVVEYFATGEGISYWLQISRNYSVDETDYELEEFQEFISDGHYYNGIEEKTEEEFMSVYASLIPPYVIAAVERKDQPAFTWQSHVHVNYS